jgi:DHA1 family bicyclomycin/chloramphenicol resistance-like MFS transporter
MTATRKPRALALVEFIPLMALIVALDALSIDTILPALPQMARDLGVANANDMQLVVTLMFLGFGAGQIFGGPLSDAVGRKPAIYVGLVIYIIGSLLGALAPSFPVLLAARLLQGFGASIPVIVVNAIVRDLYEGAPMARIMSFMGTVFILVPVLGPLVGQGILFVASWRTTFWLYVALAVPVSVWFALRQPETLAPENRLPLAFGSFTAAARDVLSRNDVVGYILCGAFITGAFLGYLSSAQQVFQDGYKVGIHFVLYFSSLALSIGVALLLNGNLVQRLGMRPMSAASLAGMALLASLFLPVVFAFDGLPPLWLTMAWLIATFLMVGILFGNLTALALEPIGHIAGVGAGLVGFLQIIVGVPLGAFIGRQFVGGITPLVTGFALLCSLSLVAMAWGERRRLDRWW